MASLRLAGLGRSLVVGGLLLGGFHPELTAQSGQAAQEWTLQNIRASWCVNFLMDSTAAEKELPRGFRPRRAADFPELTTALQNLIKNEPEYQSWVPAQFCSSHFDQLKVGDHTLGSASPSLEDTQFVGAWLIGASLGQGQAETMPSYYVANLRTSIWRLVRIAETAFIPVEYAEPGIGKVPESTEDRYRVTMGRTVITWDGHLAGDSAWAVPATEQTWYVVSSRGAKVAAAVRTGPQSAQYTVGTLQVVGNDDVAKSMRASPIRMVGPVTWGGDESIIFTR